MNPELSAAAIALLFGAAKIGAIGTVGFAIAWARARSRIRTLEERASQSLASDLGERMDRLEQSVDYMAGQVDRMVSAPERTSHQLPPTMRDE